jgi:hypothetical protein
MSGRQQARKQQTHSAEVRQVYERVLAGASVRSRYVEVAGDRVQLLEKGAGPPVVLLHGTVDSAGFFLHDSGYSTVESTRTTTAYTACSTT